MSNAARAAIGMLTAAILSGCGPAVRSTAFETYPPRSADHPIRVYSTKTPECPYEEVGLVSARQQNRLTVTMEDILEALKARAREMGGDAVVGVSQGTEPQGGAVGEISGEPVIAGTVIRFTQADCTR